MAYQSLYRRYRPRRFSDVRGQEHVVRALRNAVREGRVGHAYLFSGPRGTGKTSTARILAKALNCENLVDGEPDGTCESCLAIDAGTSYDVQELDAASNNGVEQIRELIARANLGTPGRTKVYILDEVHMLTAAASAALLKTLEEPPGHVVFVLATTDPHKVLPTIRSRTQHFDFHLLPADELAEHVAWVIHDAGLELGPEAIEHVLRAGGGSARDTLSALERVAAAGGVVEGPEPVEELLDAIAAADAGAALVAVADALAAGRDPRLLGEAVLGRLRDVFLVRMGARTDHLTPAELDRVKAWADRIGDRATTRALEAVGEALLAMRQAPDPRIPLEVALVRITRADADGSVDALAARVARLEAALASGDVPGVAPGPAGTGAPAGPSAAAPAPAGPPPSASAAEPAPPTTPTSSPGPADAAPSSAPSRGSRPADGARAELAAKRAQGQSPTARRGAAPTPGPSGPTAPPAAAPPPPPRPGSAGAGSSGGGPPAPPVPTATPPAAPAPPSPPAPTSAPESSGDAAPAPASTDTAPGPAATASSDRAAATPAPSSGGVADVGQLTALWNDVVLGSLSGLTKAMYSAGRFVAVEGSAVTFAVPNDVHRQKCEQKRPEVEKALGDRLGSPVRVTLVVDGPTASAPGPAAGGSSRSSPRPAEPEPDDYDDIGPDVHDLPDAPAGASGGLDALTEAFPGAELIEEG